MSIGLKTTDLKTPRSKKLVSVTFIKDITVFGKNGSQISATMADLSLRWDEENKRVIVTSANEDAHYGKEEWVLQAVIAKLGWATGVPNG